MRISIIIPTYKRVELLAWNLKSLAEQELPKDFETIVLNDGFIDETEELCIRYKDRLNINYIFTGSRNLPNNPVWRVPGFANNIGVKQSTGDILVFCCAEIFHLNNSIKLITQIFNHPGQSKVLSIPKAKDDDGSFLNQLRSTGTYELSLYDRQPPLINVKFPFFLAMAKDEFCSIGGYDEDFTGTDYDDSDLIDRMVVNGCYHEEAEAKIIHLWHPRLTMTPERIPRFKHNEDLYYTRQGIVHRNVGREWGILK